MGAGALRGDGWRRGRAVHGDHELENPETAPSPPELHRFGWPWGFPSGEGLQASWQGWRRHSLGPPPVGPAGRDGGAGWPGGGSLRGFQTMWRPWAPPTPPPAHRMASDRPLRPPRPEVAPWPAAAKREPTQRGNRRPRRLSITFLYVTPATRFPPWSSTTARPEPGTRPWVPAPRLQRPADLPHARPGPGGTPCPPDDATPAGR